MISQEAIQNLATKYQTPEFPNIIREYFQHLFLSNLYRMEGSQNIMFRGGTALKFIYGSPRFSEDLDFSVFNIEPYRVKNFVEDLFSKVLVEIEKIGIKVELGPKPGPTKEGYYGSAIFKIYDYPPVSVSINVSARDERKVAPEIETIASDFIPTYNLYRLPQTLLIEEKIEALLDRKKARDFYDIYYIMRKNLLTPEQKKRLIEIRNLIEILDIDFNAELSPFLPRDQQPIIKDFKTVLLAELKRQTG
jgi:predicted nucleotidyltransferase component of viral defense system